MQKKKMIWSRQDVPGPPGQEVLGPGTKQVQKSRDLRLGKSQDNGNPILNPTKKFTLESILQAVPFLAHATMYFLEGFF